MQLKWRLAPSNTKLTKLFGSGYAGAVDDAVRMSTVHKDPRFFYSYQYAYLFLEVHGTLHG